MQWTLKKILLEVFLELVRIRLGCDSPTQPLGCFILMKVKYIQFEIIQIIYCIVLPQQKTPCAVNMKKRLRQLFWRYIIPGSVLL